MRVWRPCDTVETAVAWKDAIERRNGPSSLVLTRQNLAHQPRDEAQIDAIGRGGYILRDCAGTPDLILIATGSEVDLAMSAAAELAGNDINARVVSMPCTDLFDAQDAEYRDTVLPAGVHRRIAIEAGSKDCWWRYVGTNGAIVGMDTFGESAPAEELFEHFGFSVANVVSVARELCDA
jgi:transketolase